MQADAAAAQVKVTYSDEQPPILDIKDAISKGSIYPNTGSDTKVGDPDGALASAFKVIKGEISIGTQYHMHMETQVC